MRLVLEVFAYVFSLGLIVAANGMAQEYQLWPLLIGCLGFAASVYTTIWLHNIEGDDPRTLLALFMVVWGAVTVYYGEVAIGFLTMGALMGILGFTVGVDRLSYYFGFNSRHVIPQATYSALIILIMFVLQKLGIPDAPAYVKVFAPAAFWLGSFVAFTGLLIMSSKYYEDEHYWSLQFLAVTMYMFAIALGMWFNIQPLPGMAGTFLVLYAASKPLEFNMKDAISVGISLILCGSILSGAWYVVSTNPAIAQHFFALVK